jgi:hypothetical protein
MEKSLYKIESEYLELFARIEMAEGELTPELESALEINKNELEVKSIAYVEVIKQRESFNTRIDDEIKRLQALKKQNDNIILRLKNNLLNAVNLFGNFEAGFLKFSTRKSKQVVINCDIDDLPKDYTKITIQREPNKIEIKRAIEQGQEITGCRIVENINLTIK